jgi:hypothetical protein
MIRISQTIFLLFILSSCKTKNDKLVDTKLFSTSYNNLNIDNELNNVVYRKGYLFISQRNQKIAVLDTFLNRQGSIENLINTFPISALYKANDSVRLNKYDAYTIAPQETFYLTDDYKLKLIKEKFEPSKTIGEKLFEDTTYNIFVNRIGQLGFFTYFQDKLSKKVFVLSSYSPRQIVKFKSEYFILCDGMKHDSTNTGVIKIKNPNQLFEITNKQAEKLNILFTHLATSPGLEYELLAKKIETQSLKSYGFLDSYSIPVFTFEKENKLYSIIKNDSSIYLGKHEENKIVNIQKLFDSSFAINNISSIKYNNNTIVFFDESGGKISQGIMVNYFDCGFFVIKKSSIDLYRIYKESKLK